MVSSNHQKISLYYLSCTILWQRLLLSQGILAIPSFTDRQNYFLQKMMLPCLKRPTFKFLVLSFNFQKISLTFRWQRAKWRIELRRSPDLQVNVSLCFSQKDGQEVRLPQAIDLNNPCKQRRVLASHSPLHLVFIWVTTCTLIVSLPSFQFCRVCIFQPEFYTDCYHDDGLKAPFYRQQYEINLNSVYMIYVSVSEPAKPIRISEPVA